MFKAFILVRRKFPGSNFPPDTGQLVVLICCYVLMSTEIMAFVYTWLRMWLFQDSLEISLVWRTFKVLTFEGFDLKLKKKKKKDVLYLMFLPLHFKEHLIPNYWVSILWDVFSSSKIICKWRFLKLYSCCCQFT